MTKREPQMTPRQIAREVGLPLQIPGRRRRRPANAAPSWEQLLDWAVDAYWERKAGYVDAA